VVGIGVEAATPWGRSVSTCIAGATVTGSTTGGVGTFDGARGGGCGEFCLKLGFEAWLLDLVTPLCGAGTTRFLRFATGPTPLDLIASSNATINGAG